MRLLILFLIIIVCCAWVLPAPPNIKDKDTHDYFKILYDRFGQLPVVTTNPSGNRQGQFGDTVLYQSTGNVYIFSVQIISPSGNQWKGMTLNSI